jgi:hypothetical protein
MTAMKSIAGGSARIFVWRDRGWPDNPRVDAQEQIVTLDRRSETPSDSVVAGRSCAWVSTALAADLRAQMALFAELGQDPTRRREGGAMPTAASGFKGVVAEPR